MQNMFADDVVEAGSAVGTGPTISLNGAADDTRRRFRDIFATGDKVFYCARSTEASPGSVKREFGHGAFTVGAPDTIVRNVLYSTNGNDKVNWIAEDIYIVYSAPLLDVLGPLLTGNLGALPTWAQRGFTRWSDAEAGRLIRKLYDGAVELELGRYHEASGGIGPVYTGNMARMPLDGGAANLVFTPAMRGKLIKLDVTAANRALSLPVAASTGLIECSVVGYGGTGHDVVLTPDAGDRINEGSVGAGLTIAGGTMKRLLCDAERWRTSG